MQRSYCGLIDLKSVEQNLVIKGWVNTRSCLLYTSPSPRD